LEVGLCFSGGYDAASKCLESAATGKDSIGKDVFAHVNAMYSYFP